jgi:hypothetical protein
MANFVYPKYLEAVLGGAANSDLLTVSPVNQGIYATIGTTAGNSSLQFYNQLTGLSGVYAQITNPTIVNGLLDGDDVILPAIAIGNTYGYVEIFRMNAGANSTWRMICHLDFTGISGLPAASDGGNFYLYWNAAGIIQF